MNVILCAPGEMTNSWVTGVAGAQLELPGCVAVMEQVPAFSTETVAPLTVHREGVLELKLTGSPELALADTLN